MKWSSLDQWGVEYQLQYRDLWSQLALRRTSHCPAHRIHTTPHHLASYSYLHYKEGRKVGRKLPSVVTSLHYRIHSRSSRMMQFTLHPARLPSYIQQVSHSINQSYKWMNECIALFSQTSRVFTLYYTVLYWQFHSCYHQTIRSTTDMYKTKAAMPCHDHTLPWEAVKQLLMIFTSQVRPLTERNYIYLREECDWDPSR